MYQVHTKTKGVLKFTELPKNIYWGMDGLAYLMTFDEGTCLKPIIDQTTLKQLSKPNQ